MPTGTISAIVTRRRLIQLAIILSLAPSAVAHAERVPTTIYTTADGLANNLVHRIVVDSHGYLWICTREGLSQFDGYSFTNYSTQDGLPDADITGVIETKEGRYWIGTNSGVVRFDPLGTRGPGKSDRPMFSTFRPGTDPKSHEVWGLFQDREGTTWIGTPAGLFKLNEPGTGPITFQPIDLGGAQVGPVTEDGAGTLWISTSTGLWRRFANGRLERYSLSEGLPAAGAGHAIVDRQGRIWVGTLTSGLAVLTPGGPLQRSTVAATYSTADGLPSTWINQFFEARDGTLWVGTSRGLVEIVSAGEPYRYRFRTLGSALGLVNPEVNAIAEDRAGNLWVGSTEGLVKIPSRKFTAYGEAEGIGSTGTLFEIPGDGVIAMDFSAERYFRCADQRTVLTKLPPSVAPSWGWNQMALVDHEGDWWIGTRSGVLRYHGITHLEQLAHSTPVARYTTHDGLATDVVIRLFEDSRHDVWIATVGETGPSGLSRWERSSRTLRHYTDRNALPPSDRFFASAFGEDPHGNVWIGFSGDGGLVRYRNDRFERFGSEDGIPPGWIRNLITDARGRLWAASYRGGLIRIDHPSDERPVFSRYTTEQGLSSNEVSAVVEDTAGRIYAATGRALDRLDPETGRIRTYRKGEHLPVGEIGAAIRDRAGVLWASHSAGVIRVVPSDDAPLATPAIFISGIRILGEPQHISALGHSELPYFELPWNRNSLDIDFVAPGFGAGEDIRYQFKLEGGGADWSRPSDQRRVTYANLAPGHYRFQARAVSADFVTSSAVAGFSFRIWPPIWQRWWFRSAAGLLIAALAYGFYRSRVSRLLEVVAMRTRIATDLHDDIGANLTRIAVLSEVVRRKGHVDADEELASIATVARESVTAMSDIVWAISPGRDGLSDLTSRMRNHAEEVFGSNGTQLTFSAPAAIPDLRLSVDTRRDVYLIFKEAINNAARHSGCSRVRVSLQSDDAGLTLSVVDDGAGFDLGSEDQGNGLASMRSRAERLGAKFDISSRLGNGTTVRLEVPHHRVH